MFALYFCLAFVLIKQSLRADHHHHYVVGLSNEKKDTIFTSDTFAHEGYEPLKGAFCGQLDYSLNKRVLGQRPTLANNQVMRGFLDENISLLEPLFSAKQSKVLIFDCS